MRNGKDASHGNNGLELHRLAPWFGSKVRLAPRITQELGEHRFYWELFCGSMSVLLSKPQVPYETVNDLHGDLINLARTLRDEPRALRLYRMLRRTLTCEQFHRESLGVLRSRRKLTPLQRAYFFTIASWMGYRGKGGAPLTATAFGLQRRAFPAFVQLVRQLPSIGRRLRNVRILNRDAIGLAGEIPDEAGVAVYCDPPYLMGRPIYVHEFESGDHARLAEALSRFKRTRVVVSYMPHPLIRKLYKGWAIKRVVRPRRLGATFRRGAPQPHDTEWLIVNRRPSRSDDT